MPERPQEQIPGLRVDSAVFELLKAGNPGYIALRPELDLRESRLQAEAREELKDFPGELAFPLFVERQPLGLLIVGTKKSGDAFTRTDAQLLSDVTTNIALVINQISIKTELLHAKELDLLGRMSQGMAHDLNNLVTPVWTLLQLLNEGVPADTLRIDIAPVAVRNLQTMREYIKEALFFSQNLRPDFQVTRLDVLVEEVVDLARQNKRKGKDIRYTFRSCGDAPVEMDQVLIRRLLTNILANAVDASKEGDTLDVEVIRLLKTDAERDWFRVRVTDHGSGIPSENLDRIFQPYFSTKKTGDEDRGFGLGLAICRKIAGLHGGNLVISSELGRGTIVNLDLPSHQKAAKTPVRPTLVAAGT
jgi:signal transduction histidine kinase